MDRFGAEERDFKYVLQDLTKTMIGARFTYRELMGEERVPFKFQTIIDRLILTYADPDMTIGEHLLQITPQDKNYRIYENLKVKLHYYVSKETGGYVSKSTGLREFVTISENERKDIVMHEVILSNLALMSFKM